MQMTEKFPYFCKHTKAQRFTGKKKLMNIYFAGSIRGGRGDREIYVKLIGHLKRYGRVLTEHIGDEGLGTEGEPGMVDQWIYERDVEWIGQSDVLVAEVSTPSLGVGYELGKAEALGKKILCLYRHQAGQRLSAMIGGNRHMTNVSYATVDDACRLIDNFMKENFDLP